MKRKLFIGSSGGRGVSIGQAVAAQIKETCDAWLECDLWDRGDVFAINRSFLDSLMRASQRYHYGIFIATKDDPTDKKGASIVEPRDNVILEMGLVLGSMGLTRSFLLVEEGVSLPSDFEGITMPRFLVGDEAKTRNAVSQLVAAISRTRRSFNLKPIPSAALALGYFDNFLKPFAGRYWEKNKERAVVKVLLPKRLISYREKHDLDQLIELYGGNHASEDVSIYQPGTRPVIKKLTHQSVYWDIPTTIFTLKQLIDKLPSMAELIGVDEGQNQWLLSEMNEFGRSLIELKNETLAFQRGIVLEIVLLEIENGKLVEMPWAND